VRSVARSTNASSGERAWNGQNANMRPSPSLTPPDPFPSPPLPSPHPLREEFAGPSRSASEGSLLC
jgi:hypothetical protein